MPKLQTILQTLMRWMVIIKVKSDISGGSRWELVSICYINSLYKYCKIVMWLWYYSSESFFDKILVALLIFYDANFTT